jgi:sugar phosphate isomerase/epimerase
MLKQNAILTVIMYLAAVAPAFAADVASGDKSASFKGKLGLQLYSLRAQFAKDVPGTLDKVRDMGFKYVESAGTYGEKPGNFKKDLNSRGLTAVSAHFPFEKFRDDVESVAKEAKALGVKYAGCAWIAHSGAFTEKDCREAANVFNHAGEALAKHGIKFFYHTHGYEFQPYGSENLFDLLLAETKPEVVTYEMDVFWVVHGGQNPVSLFEKYKGRFDLVHLKDMKVGTPINLLTGSTSVSNDVAMGTGQIDYRRILPAAAKAGVKWYFIEDESPNSEKQIPQSVRYLKEVKW